MIGVREAMILYFIVMTFFDLSELFSSYADDSLDRMTRRSNYKWPLVRAWIHAIFAGIVSLVY